MAAWTLQSDMAPFDFDAVFGEDYLHFYLPLLDEDHNRAEAEEVVETLGLRPGDRVLDAPSAGTAGSPTCWPPEGSSS